MSPLAKYTCKKLGNVEIKCVAIGTEPWFKSKGITQIFEHTNTTKAPKDHEEYEDGQKHIDSMHNAPSEPTVRADATIFNVNFVNDNMVCTH